MESPLLHTFEQALNGLACSPALLAIAKQHPYLVPQLLEAASFIRADISAAAGPASGHATSPTASRASGEAVAAAPSEPQLPSGFVTLRDVPCIVPRGKHDIEFHELGVTLRPSAPAKQSSSSSSASVQTPLVVRASNVTGVFYLSTKDKYKTGPAGLTHIVLLTLLTPVSIGGAKTLHSALCFSETGAALLKAGAATSRLLRAVDATRTQDAAGLDRSQLVAGSEVAGEHAFALLRKLLALVYGRIGEHDKSIFSSFGGESSVRCYNKTNDGCLFPLRRAFVFGIRPLICLPHSSVEAVSVARAGGAARTFDLDIKMTDGKTVQFSMIANEELDALRQYVSTRTWGGAAPPASSTSSSSSSNSSRAVAPAQQQQQESSGAAPAGASAPQAAAAAAAEAPTSEDGGAANAAVQPDAPSSGAAAAAPARNMNDIESDDEAGAGGAEGEDEDEEEDDSEFNSDDDSTDGDDGEESDDDDDNDDEEEDDATDAESSAAPQPKASSAAASSRKPKAKKRRVEVRGGESARSSSDSEGANGDGDAAAGEEDADMSGDELRQLLSDAGVTREEVVGQKRQTRTRGGGGE